MKPENQAEVESGHRTFGQVFGGFFRDLLSGILRDLLVVVIVFILATGISALVCLYYGLPLQLSLIGGFLVIGVFLFLHYHA
ncbi:MAG: hypothetical protein HKN70_00185 [Gammaproteobacteria bacterium]|nr:hypothetical protein [Gammaproteobacteria bacterium]